jgi:putative transcriptional regulator
MVKTNALGRKLLESANQALHAAKTGDMSGITIREVEITAPGQYAPREIKALRDATGTSQRVFAELLGVSKELAAQWEYGIRQPAPLARRLLDKVKEDPSGFAGSLMKRRALSTT